MHWDSGSTQEAASDALTHEGASDALTHEGASDACVASGLSLSSGRICFQLKPTGRTKRTLCDTPRLRLVDGSQARDAARAWS